MQVISKKQIWGIIITIIAIGLAIASTALFEDADKSKNYVCQMPISGRYTVWTDGGLQMQLFGNMQSYNKTSQVEFSGVEKNAGGYVGAGSNPAAALTFNDRSF